MLPIKLRRSVSVVVPLFSAAAFFGIIESMFKVGITENLMQTGITLGIILAILNIFVAWLSINHQVP